MLDFLGLQFLEEIPIHIYIYSILGIAVAYLLSRKSYRPQAPIILTPQEINELLTTWKPTPFTPEIEPEERYLLEKIPVITGYGKGTIITEGKGELIDCSTTDFLGFAHNNQTIQDAAVKTLRTSGTGSCGPRNFYGTLDVHLDLESRVAKFLGVESAILYASALATNASVIPAFANRDDYILSDEKVKKSIQLGNYISRATVKYFRHNDVNHLEQLMMEVNNKMSREKKLVRRFVVVEGIYYNYGTICRLREVVALAKQYHFRIILDDTIGIGTLGETGRGVVEHWGLKISDIHIVTADIQLGMGSLGGVCCGDKDMVTFQRLNGSGYMYSASNPPFLASCATAAFDFIDNNPQILKDIRANAKILHKIVSEIPGVEPLADFDECPYVCVKLVDNRKPEDKFEEMKILQEVVDYAANKGVAIAVVRSLKKERTPPPPHIRLTVSVTHSPEQLATVDRVLKDAFAKVLSY